MKKLLAISLVLVIAAALIFGSCGDGDKTTTTKTTTATTTTTTQATTTTSEQPTGTTTTTATQTTTTTPTTHEPYGTITAASADFGWESTDPVYYESLWGWSWYDSLIRWDENGGFVGHVADSWEYEDGVYTFHIRDDVYFHNGDHLTAEDIKFTVDRFGDMTLSTNPWSYYLSSSYNKADSIVVDEYTYQFVQDHVEPAQLIIFAWTRILPKDYYESVGMDAFRAAPIGSGPWKFVEIIPETSLTIQANTDYWIPEEVPYYEYYVELQVPEQSTRIAMLKTGEVDIAYGIDYDRLANLMDLGFATVAIGDPVLSNYTYQGTWLPEAGPTYDIRVRQAMSYALNRQEICDTWFAGLAKPGGTWYMHEGCFGWVDELGEADPYDPAMAAQLLQEAGYPDAYDDPSIHFYTTPAGQDYILLLIDYWQDAGIDVQLEVVDSTVNGAYFFNFTRLQPGDTNVGWMFAWTYGSFFNSAYQCTNMYCSWGVHNSGDDPMLDELYLKAVNEPDLELWEQYWSEFQVYAKSTYINVGIATIEPLIIYNPTTLGEWTGRNWVSYADAMNGVMHP